MKRATYHYDIGDVFEVPLKPGICGLIQRAYTDINKLGYDIGILYDFLNNSNLNGLDCGMLNKIPIKVSIYVNISAGIKYNNWRFISNCPLPYSYILPMFKEYVANNDDYDGVNKWRLYDPKSGLSSLPLRDNDLAGLVSDIGFRPVDIVNYLLNGHHGLTHEMFN